MSNELMLSSTGSIKPKNLAELIEYAKILADSTLVPKDFQGKPGNVIIALQMGAEIGLSATNALQSIAVVNGKPSVYGDGAAALVRGKGKPKIFKEYEIGERGDPDWKKWDNDYGWICEIQRQDSDEIIKRIFIVADAKRAGLWGKAGPWSLYPQRMLMMKARSWAMRDSHPDILKGLAIYEEAIDIEPISEPERATISINDFSPSTPKAEPENKKEIIETTKEIFNASDETEQLSRKDLIEKIGKVCMHEAKEDKNKARLIYHQYADIINPKSMEKVKAPELKNIAVGQAKIIWEKIKAEWKQRGHNIDEALSDNPLDRFYL